MVANVEGLCFSNVHPVVRWILSTCRLHFLYKSFFCSNSNEDSKVVFVYCKIIGLEVHF